MPAYDTDTSLDHAMDTEDRVSPGPRNRSCITEIYSPGELISPRDLSRVSEAEAGEVVVGVEHVEEVITRAMASLGTEVANTELLHMTKIQMLTDIRTEARALTPVIAMSLTNLAINTEKKDDLFSYKHQIVRSVPAGLCPDTAHQEQLSILDTSHLGDSSLRQAESFTVLPSEGEVEEEEEEEGETIASEIQDEVMEDVVEEEEETPHHAVSRDDTQESVVSVVAAEGGHHGHQPQQERRESREKFLRGHHIQEVTRQAQNEHENISYEDNSRKASQEVPRPMEENHRGPLHGQGYNQQGHQQYGQQHGHQYGQQQGHQQGHQYGQQQGHQQGDPPRQGQQGQYGGQVPRLVEEEEDISQFIDNDEDAYESETLDSVRSPRVTVNYLTNLETQSSFLRRQRLTTASTLDLPQGVDSEAEDPAPARAQASLLSPGHQLEVGGGGGGQDPRKKTFTLPPRQSLLMQTLNTNYRPIQQGWLARKVIGRGGKAFYDRRPQSRIRINTVAHAGFCGMCGPCSCNQSHAPSHASTPATSALPVKKGKDRLRVDTYWNTSSVPEKYRRREKAGLEKVKEILEAEENISGHDG